VLAVGAGVAAFATMLSAFAILTRELPRNYLATLPASASLDVDGIDDALLEAVRQRPRIEAARATSRMAARVLVGGGVYRPLTIYVADDFGAMGMTLVTREAGAWPPPAGAIALEREALPLTGAKLGDALTIETPDGVRRAVPVAATVHDPGIPAPGRGQVLSGYAARGTAAAFGGPERPTTLMIRVRDRPYDEAAIEREVTLLAAWLRATGHPTRAIRIAPPGKHPHQAVMTSMLALLLVFSGIALALGAALSAATTGALLAEQRQAIGVMKALGARTGQIARLYLALALGVGTSGTALGLGVGVVVGRGLAKAVLTRFLNFDMADGSLPAWALASIVAAGVLLPVATALPAIASATRASVRDALSQVAPEAAGAALGRIAGVIGRLGVSLPLVALRSSLRRPARLILSLALLATAGATWISSLELRRGAQAQLVVAASERRYDLEVYLSRPAAEGDVVPILTGVSGVVGAAPWKSVAAAPSRGDGLAIERTFADGVHGSLTLAAVPEAFTPFAVSIVDGRWLEPADVDAVVLNQAALDFFPGAKVGDMLGWSVRGESFELRLVGVARQRLTAALGYVSPRTFADRARPTGATAYRVQLADHGEDAVARAATAVEQALAAQGIAVRFVLTEAMLRREVDGHYGLLIAALAFIAAMMAVVGAVGLSSTMSIRILERRREIGVLRAVGASPRAVFGAIVTEGVVVGVASWGLAVIVSVPLSSALGAFVGNATGGTPFPPVFAPGPVARCLVAAIVGAALAATPAALRVSRAKLPELLGHP
jgi:putative ABC transport system permease protein